MTVFTNLRAQRVETTWKAGRRPSGGLNADTGGRHPLPGASASVLRGVLTGLDLDLCRKGADWLVVLFLKWRQNEIAFISAGKAENCIALL